MEISKQAEKYLMEMSKWATFIAIVGFIGIALLVVMSFSIGTIMANLPDGYLGGISPSFFAFFYLIMAGIYFIPVFFLFQFGHKTKQALINKDSSLLTFGLKKLNAHYKFIGILLIIAIVLYFTLIMFGAFGALLMS
jgi:hypothetical protein